MPWNLSDGVQLVQDTSAGIFWQGLNEIAAGMGTNGELWVASRLWENSGFVPRMKFQLGRNMRWRAATFVLTEDAIIALRSDGTLWKWSPLWELDDDPSKIRATQLGDHSDWIALPDSRWGIALAADGSLWSWGVRDCIWLEPSRKPV